MLVWVLIISVLMPGSTAPIGIIRSYSSKEFCESVVKNVTEAIIAENPKMMAVKCVPINLGEPS